LPKTLPSLSFAWRELRVFLNHSNFDWRRGCSSLKNPFFFFLEMNDFDEVDEFGHVETDDNFLNSVQLNKIVSEHELTETELNLEVPKQLSIYYDQKQKLLSRNKIPWRKFSSLRWCLSKLVAETKNVCSNTSGADVKYDDLSNIIYKGSLHFMNFVKRCSKIKNHPVPTNDFLELFRLNRCRDAEFAALVRRVFENSETCALADFADEDGCEDGELEWDRWYLDRKLDETECTPLDAYVVADAFQAELSIFYIDVDCSREEDEVDAEMLRARQTYILYSYGEYNFAVDHIRPVWHLLTDRTGQNWYPLKIGVLARASCGGIPEETWCAKNCYRFDHTSSVTLCECESTLQLLK